ncbi:putative toxin YpjF [compost metagenome]
MQNTLMLPSPAAVAPRPSPLEDWQKLLTFLLDRHYGLTLSDTPFSDDAVIQEHIDRALSPMDAINYVVERYGLRVIALRTFFYHSHSAVIPVWCVFSHFYYLFVISESSC